MENVFRSLFSLPLWTLFCNKHTLRSISVDAMSAISNTNENLNTYGRRLRGLLHLMTQVSGRLQHTYSGTHCCAALKKCCA